MINKFIKNFKQKSLQQRFLFILGLVLIVVFAILSSIFIFWEDMPVQTPYKTRKLFGVLTLFYAFYRFYKISNRS
jgi:uncharacterized membrane protein